MSQISPKHRDVPLVELLDRVVDRGVVLAGDITISVADVDLIYLGLRVLIRTPIITDPPGEREMSRKSAEKPDDFLLRLRDSAR